MNIDEFRLLKLFVDHIIIPNEVYEEASQQLSTKKFLDVEITDGFLSVESYEDVTMFNEIHYILDRGESAAITLAAEKKLPLIIDEKKGRRFAQMQGVEIIGLVGIIRFLYLEERLDRAEVLSLIEKLNRSDFRISQNLLHLILA
jgi:predicted nucleic acid-binding protein